MISANIHEIRERIARACQRAGRDPAEVILVAVSKTFPSGPVREAIQGGVADIGENYVQELVQKRAELQDLNVRWHFIGHLQSNKVKYIAAWVTMIHSVDNLPLAQEIDRRSAAAGRVLDVLLEVNTTGEGSKFGVSPREALPLVRSMEHLRNLRIAGLMTIGPFLPDAEGSRPMFRTLRNVREELIGLGQANVAATHLSMGMTGDFEVAIEEGATLLRIGTAIFGSRKRKTP